MALFSDSFWGEKHTGFEVLTHNLKNGEQSCKDLEDFLKQCHILEETYIKALARVVKNVGSYSSNSSFSPVWQAVKASLEKISAAHSDLSKKWQDLIKDVHKHTEGLVKKYKTIKESQTSTQETMLSMQSISTHLSKSKDAYNAKFSDYKKLLMDKATIKKIEKSEADFKKATEDYKNNVTKYNSTREEFQSKMSNSADSFQESETEYLVQMDEFMKKYASIQEEKHTEIGELHYEFHSSLSALSVDTLLEKFIEAKGTGTDPPGAVEFEEADLASLPPPPSPQEEADNVSKSGSEGSTPTTTTNSMMHLNIANIFGKRARKKKKAAENSKDTDSNKDSESLDKVSTTSEPTVDEEGYTIRKETKSKGDDSWDSSSDSDDDSDDRRHNKLKVEIKPLSSGSPALSTNSSVPHLNNSTPGSISSSTIASNDLLDLFGNGPTAANSANSSSRGSTPISWSTPQPDAMLSAEDREVFDTVGQSRLPTTTGAPTITPIIPRPPSRKDISSGRLSAGRFSPMSGMMTRQDSFGTQGMQSFSATSVNPDVIPLAIAMTENIRARFRGTEHESQVVGDVMMSFSKEYIARENLPSLSFQLAGRSPEQIMVNKEFISSNGDVHTFDTTKLHQHLKSKAAADASVKHVNLQVARYTLTVTCLPLNLVAFWKCEPDTTDFRLDYEYIGSALCKPLPLTNIQFLVPVNGGVNTHNTLPHGVWSPEHRKLLWKIAELKSGSQSKGSVKARFGLADGPSTPGTVDVKFFCDGTILSGTKFELNTKHYKVSYTKHRMVANVAVDTDKLVTYV